MSIDFHCNPGVSTLYKSDSTFDQGFVTAHKWILQKASAWLSFGLYKMHSLSTGSGIAHIYILDQQDLTNTKRRNDVFYRPIFIKCLPEYTQYQHLLQLHSSHLCHRVPSFKRSLYYCSHPWKSSVLTQPNREYNHAYSLPGFFGYVKTLTT